MELNFDAITVQDCLDCYEKKGIIVITHNGEVIGFTHENNAPEG